MERSEFPAVLPFELHTHTVASGHGTKDTVADLAKAACKKGMFALGISEHGPATPLSCSESYFRGLKTAPKKRAGIRVYYGAEANILDETGRLDLSGDTLCGLDFVIASIHPNSYFCPAYEPVPLYEKVAVYETGRLPKAHPVMKDAQEAVRCNTEAYIGAMQNPFVRVIGHPDDVRYPVDVKALVAAAVRYGVALEVNEASLEPGGHRGDTRSTMRAILLECQRFGHPVLLSSDSHGASLVGEAPLAWAFLSEMGFPKELVLNLMPPEAFWSLKRKASER